MSCVWTHRACSIHSAFAVLDSVSSATDHSLASVRSLVELQCSALSIDVSSARIQTSLTNTVYIILARVYVCAVWLGNTLKRRTNKQTSVAYITLFKYLRHSSPYIYLPWWP